MDVNYKFNLKENVHNHAERPFAYTSKVTSEFSDFLYEQREKRNKLQTKADEGQAQAVTSGEDSKCKC